MRDVLLLRKESDDHGTFGEILIPGMSFACFTIELPWRENKRGSSCIPKGSYDVEMRLSPRYGQVYWVKEVPDRNWILIHPGNFAGDVSKGFRSNSKGCILPGAGRGKILDQKVVLASRTTVHNLVKCLEYKPFKLHITGV